MVIEYLFIYFLSRFLRLWRARFGGYLIFDVRGDSKYSQVITGHIDYEESDISSLTANTCLIGGYIRCGWLV